jgi:hypothetical protein
MTQKKCVLTRVLYKGRNISAFKLLNVLLSAANIEFALLTFLQICLSKDSSSSITTPMSFSMYPVDVDAVLVQIAPVPVAGCHYCKSCRCSKYPTYEIYCKLM